MYEFYLNLMFIFVFSCLVQKLNIMRQNSMGDGDATCILCAEQFGKFMGSAPIICMECKKVWRGCIRFAYELQWHFSLKPSADINLSVTSTENHHSFLPLC